MNPALRALVPSRSLLRFLRSQSEFEASFIPTQDNVARSLATTSSCRRTCLSHNAPRKTSRAFTTTCQRRSSDLHSSTSLLDQGRSLRRLPKTNGTAHATALFSTTTVACKSTHHTGNSKQSAATWQERLWGRPARKGAKPLRPDDLPSQDETESGPYAFSSGRSMSAKASLEPRLRCTEVDEAGKVILVDGEFKKMELIAKVWRHAVPDQLNSLTEICSTVCFLEI